MSYQRPSYPELLARIEVDLAAVPASLRMPLAATWARTCHGQYGYLDWIAAQASPLTCDSEQLYAWASLYGVDRLAATAASGAIAVTGAPGASVLVGAVWSGPNGLAYEVVEAATITSTGARVQLRCQVAGAAGNLAAGQVLTATAPIAGVTGAANVMAGGLTGGAEIEALDDWRIRVADEWAVVVADGGRSGGRAADYRWWAKSAHPSVTSALVQPGALGLGTVIVRPICSGLPNRMPTAGVLSAVQAYILDRSPAGAEVHVQEPIPRPLSLALDVSPLVDSTPLRAGIEAALQAMLVANSTERAIVTVDEIDVAVASVTSQAVRVAPLADQALGSGEIFSSVSITWL